MFCLTFSGQNLPYWSSGQQQQPNIITKASLIHIWKSSFFSQFEEMLINKGFELQGIEFSSFYSRQRARCIDVIA